MAKNASITLVYGGLATGETCGGGRTFGAFDALQYAIDHNIAPIISNSYGNCEAILGSAFALTMQGWEQQKANTQGQTVISSSGDSGAADCDFQVTSATHGIAVDLPAAIPEVTAMGGTEFTGDADACPSGTCSGDAPPDLPYWAAALLAALTPFSSALLVYIPEMAWNDTANAQNVGGLILASGGSASAAGFFSKPTRQTGTGVPNDGRRDVLILRSMHRPIMTLIYFVRRMAINGAIVSTCTSGFRTGAGGNCDRGRRDLGGCSNVRRHRRPA